MGRGLFKKRRWLYVLVSWMSVLAVAFLSGTAVAVPVDAAASGWTEPSGWPTATALLYANGTLYAGTSTGIEAYSGGSWTTMSGSPSNVATLFAVGTTLYAGGTAGAYAWIWNGSTWAPMTNAPPAVSQFAYWNGTLYAVAGARASSLYAYTGGSWGPVAGSPTDVSDLAVLNGTFYVGTYREGIKTYDGTSSFPLSAGSPNAQVVAVANGTLYAAPPIGSEIYEYVGGSQWKPRYAAGNVSDIVGVNGFLYASTQAIANPVYSNETGSWQLMSTEPNTYIDTLIDGNGTLYAIDGSNNIWQDVVYTPAPSGPPAPPALRFLALTSALSTANPIPTVVTQPTGMVGTFFFDVFHSAGGVGYGIWSLKSGTLPPGLSLDASGALIGTPTAPGTYTFTAQATDLAGNSTTDTVTVTISPAQ